MATVADIDRQPAAQEPGAPPTSNTAVIRPDGPTFEPPAQAGAMQRATTALATQRAGTMQQAFQGLMPSSIGEAYILAGYLAKSNGIPKSLRSGSKSGGPESVLTVILAGMELGLTPIRSIQSITNIQGTLALRADLQLALTKRSGVLSLYDEGFEERGRTDGNLARRLELVLRDPDQVEQAMAKILAAVEGMPAGKPYGWALGRRGGDHVVHVRTFTWLDAERAEIWEKDDDDGGSNQPRSKKKLSEKFNYVSFPGDMYPKRARTRILQILASDVLAGLPAVEQLEGGQILDAEFTPVVDDQPVNDVDTLLAEIDGQNPELGTSIRSGFNQLNMGRGKQLAKLTQFKDRPADLLDWLKTEWANQAGSGRKKPDVLSQDDPGKKSQPAAEKKTEPTQAEDKRAADIADAKAARAASVDAQQQRAAVEADTRKPSPAKSVADRFKQSKLKTF